MMDKLHQTIIDQQTYIIALELMLESAYDILSEKTGQSEEIEEMLNIIIPILRHSEFQKLVKETLDLKIN